MKSLSFAIIFLLSLSLICCKQNEAIENNNDGLIICPVLPDPSFPGGSQSLKLFIEKNLKYPINSGSVSGTVFVSFVVKEDGSLSNFSIVKGLCKECDENAIEVFKRMPKWSTATNRDGKAEQVRMICPVKFEL